MTNSTKREQRMLREIAHFLLPLLCCEFCGKPLLDPKLADKVFGNKAHTPMPKTLKLTVHHRNGKHRDNSRKNKLLNSFVENATILYKMGTLNPTKEALDVQFAICGNTSLCHSECHRRHEMSLSHREGSFKPKPMRERVKELLTKIINSPSEYTVPETTFINKMSARAACKEGALKSKFTRYEIRRLKKLAAKGAKKC